jgi:hypothetical protein
MLFASTIPAGRIEWKALRDRLDPASVATGLLGPASGRKGGGRGLWWKCPFHKDGQERTPSLCIKPGEASWRCRACGEHGDAATLVMKIKGVGFPDAVRYLAGDPARTTDGVERRAEEPGPRLDPEAAARLVAEAEVRLWGPEGGPGLDVLHARGLRDEAIRSARLGFVVRPLDLPGHPRGIVIPWFSGPTLTLIKIRQPEGRSPKYYEAFRDPIRRLGLYPGPEAVRHGYPLVIPEGELDRALLAQELSGLAGVVTLGSASDRPDASILGAMLPAAPWYVATDGDDAGDRAAAGWPARARRVRPPAPYKDWTDAHRAGVGLRRWWVEVMAGVERPAPFTRAELAGWRWGGADPTPGIILDRPDRGRMLAALRAVAADPGPEAPSPLGRFLANLADRGLRLDGEIVFPRIELSVTGRACYSGPALQNMPAAERLSRIGPVVDGRVFVRIDYGQIEPRILLAILRRCGLIAWDAGADLDRDLIGDETIDRDVAKVEVNKVINGGWADPGTSGRLAEFIAAVDVYRAELAPLARSRGFVETLAGRRIPLAPDEPNYSGKAVNRVVQGTAADIFHRAAVGADRAIEAAGLPAAVAFLIFDELWVECGPEAAAEVARLVRSEMEAAAAAEGLAIPARLDESAPESA